MRRGDSSAPFSNTKPIYADFRRKRRDFLHKLSNYYAREYDLVAVEDLYVSRTIESPSNSRNTASAAWRTFLSLLEYNCEREGMHFVAVDRETRAYLRFQGRSSGHIGHELRGDRQKRLIPLRS